MPDRCLRLQSRCFVVASVIAVILLTISGCGLRGRSASPGETTQVQQIVDYGPCLPMYGGAVLSASMNRDGTRVLLVSSQRPDFVDPADWGREDRALYLLEYQEAGAPLMRPIARSWEATDEIPPYATPSDEAVRSPLPIPEHMLDVQLAESADRFVVGVTRIGVYGRYAKLYTGSVPSDAGKLLSPGPDGGLTIVPINDYQGTEGVTSFALAPDGSKLAAVVGSQGEIRVYDFAASQLTVYDMGEDGKPVVRHDLPPAFTSIEQQRRPAVASTGTMYLRWSPASDRLAISMDLGVANTSLAILDIATGNLTVVQRFRDRTVPHVAWSNDGQSLFVIVTRLSAPQTFGDTEIRRLAAAENGRQVAPGGVLTRPLGYRGEPGALVSFGDDEHFAFIWDGSLYRLDMPGGVPAQATYLPLTPARLRIPYQLPSVSLAKERVLFVASDEFDSRVAERSFALHDDCPITSTGVATSTSAAEGAATPAATTSVPEATAVPVEETQPTTPETTAESEGAAPTGGATAGATATPAAATP